MKILAKIVNVLFGLFIVFGIPHLLHRPGLYAGTWLIALFVFMYLDDAIEDNL